MEKGNERGGQEVRDRDRCSALLSYSLCTRQTSHSCRGDLTYHSAVRGIEDLLSHRNCTRSVSPSLRGPFLAPHSIPDPLLSPREGCDYSHRTLSQTGHAPRYLTCALFGRLHLRSFSRSLETCWTPGAWPLLHNHYLSVQVTNTQTHNKTVTTQVTAIFRNSKECIEPRVYQAGGQGAGAQEIRSPSEDHLPASFVDGTANGGERGGGYSLVIEREEEEEDGEEEGLITIRAPYIGTTLRVRRVGQSLGITLRIPEDIAASHSPELDLQLCATGCPKTQRLPRFSPSLRWPPKAAQECTEALGTQEAMFHCCVFDSGFSKAVIKAAEDIEALSSEMHTVMTSPNGSHSLHSPSLTLPLACVFTVTALAWQATILLLSG